MTGTILVLFKEVNVLPPEEFLLQGKTLMEKSLTIKTNNCYNKTLNIFWWHLNVISCFLMHILV